MVVDGLRAPELPPVFRAFAALGDVGSCAKSAAQSGAEEGALYWSVAPERIALALVLHGDRPLAEAAEFLAVAQVGVADALAALIPARLPVTMVGPDRLFLNDAEVGRLRLEAAADGEPPPWLVLEVAIARAAEDETIDPGLTPERTTLAEEGCADLDPVDLIEAIARHLLAWTARWVEEGPAAIMAARQARGQGVMPDWHDLAALRAAGCLA
jgi:biotin-(acetyl-CoA carboxylase) ligase